MVRAELDKIKASALQVVDKTLQLEHNPIYTQNTDLVATGKRKWSLFYARVRQDSGQFLITNDIVRLADPDSEESAGEDPEESEGEDSEEVFPREDKFQQALSVMADVRAYFEVAYKVVNIPKMTVYFQGITSNLFQRVIDNIPLVIEHELHQAALTNFQTSLFQSLPKGPDSSERTKMLLSEDPIVARKRLSLESKKAMLTQIKVRLDEFHRKVGMMLGS